MPTPRFRVRSRSASGTLPERTDQARRSRECCQVERSTRPSRPCGGTRARLAARPPPVTCENPRTPLTGAARPRRSTGNAAARSRQSAAYTRVGSSSSSPDGAAQLVHLALQAPARHVQAPCAPASTRSSEYPKRPCRSARRPRARGPGRRSSSASTRPVAAPATSYSSSASRPRVLPPSRRPPGRYRQPVHMPRRYPARYRRCARGTNLARGNVVGHEQGASRRTPRYRQRPCPPGRSRSCREYPRACAMAPFVPTPSVEVAK